MSDRLEQIEVRIAYLEQANGQLSDALIQQQQELRALRTLLGTLTDRLEASQSAPSAYTAEDEKPPHY
jgi:SlyX protein